MLNPSWSAALHELGAAWMGREAPLAAPRLPAVPQQQPASATTFDPEPSSFRAVLDRAWTQVRNSQQQADQMAQAVASGSVQGPDLVAAVNGTQQAALLLSLVVTVRNRAVEAYQEIMRMPV